MAQVYHVIQGEIIQRASRLQMACRHDFPEARLETGR